MRLGAATDGDVVRNERNRSHYRFARIERGRARIRPLELFPNGRLIPKPQDTLVDAALAVRLIGPWFEGMTVEGGPPRARYEEELRRTLARLMELEDGYELLPVNGTGKQSRGSWMNKIKNARARVEAIEAGLADPAGGPVALAAEAEARSGAAIRARDVVLLPSGRAGLVMATTRTPGGVVAKIRTLGDGRVALEIPAVPIGALRPYGDSQLCTL